MCENSECWLSQVVKVSRVRHFLVKMLIFLNFVLNNMLKLYILLTFGLKILVFSIFILISQGFANWKTKKLVELKLNLHSFEGGIWQVCWAMPSWIIFNFLGLITYTLSFFQCELRKFVVHLLSIWFSCSNSEQQCS